MSEYNNSRVDFRIARVEGYWALGLYITGEKEPYEYKIYDSLRLLLTDVKTMSLTLDSIELPIDDSIIDLLKLRRN